MDEATARKILGTAIQSDNSLGDLPGVRFLSWHPGDDDARLDDAFTADELEAIAWWMRNKKAQ